jgi:hypothetical protein
MSRLPALRTPIANQIRINIIKPSNTQKAKRNVASLFIAETPTRGLMTEPLRGGDVKRPMPLPSLALEFAAGQNRGRIHLSRLSAATTKCHNYRTDPLAPYNTNCSYWVGVGASSAYPYSLLGGDRNLCGGATISANGNQDANYGFSSAVGSTIGADMQLSTNGQIGTGSGGGNLETGTYCQWSTKLHSAGYPGGAGNILLGDGSVQQVTSSSFRNWLKNATDNGNYGPSGAYQVNAVRLVFP